MPPAISCMSTYAPPRSSRSISTSELCMSASTKFMTREVLDGALRPALAARGTRRASTGRTRARSRPRPPSPSCSTIARRSPIADLPQVVGGPAALVLGDRSNGSRSGVAVRLGLGHPLAAEVDERLAGCPSRTGASAGRTARSSASVRSWARGMRMPPASAYRPGRERRGACRSDRRRGSAPRARVTRWPWRFSSNAATRPASPAPTMTTRLGAWATRSRPASGVARTSGSTGVVSSGASSGAGAVDPAAVGSVPAARPFTPTRSPTAARRASRRGWRTRS